MFPALFQKTGAQRMKFKFKGDADTPFAEVFGLSWKAGDVQDVTDAHAIKKLKNHPQFEAVGDTAPPASKKAKPATDDGA